MALRLQSIRADPLSFLQEVQQRYGDHVAFPAPGPPVLLLNAPEDIRRVLQEHSRSWTKHTVQYQTLARVTGPGLLASAQSDWLSRRRIAGPAFHHERVDAMAATMREAAGDLLPTWGRPISGVAGERTIEVDVEAMATDVTLRVVGRALFGYDLSSVGERLTRATAAAAELIVALARAVIPVPAAVPTPLNRRLRAATQELDQVCRQLIADRRRAGGDEPDLLGQLLAAGLTDRAVRDELVTMVVAGHETVATALMWTLLLLARHPEAQQRLRRELAALRPAHGSATGGLPAAALLRALPWTRAVIDESLRLYPPAWVMSRRARSADLVAGRHVPPGTLAIVSPWLVHRTSPSWEAPEAFRPERFLGTGTSARADYLPFGLGPRLCIGRDMALLELVVLLTELLREHTVSMRPGSGLPGRDAFITVRPHGGLRLRFTSAAPGEAAT